MLPPKRVEFCRPEEFQCPAAPLEQPMPCYTRTWNRQVDFRLPIAVEVDHGDLSGRSAYVIQTNIPGDSRRCPRGRFDNSYCVVNAVVIRDNEVIFRPCSVEVSPNKLIGFDIR